ncbi:MULTISPECIES: hypothetical protein [Methanosarcina]|uniref:Uncharacterized protein n=1 Tax=Methanosarcina vacuolata Z-761 TaxID=1434123 RepID=A0A0E3Q5S6_9EURY|nr:MULTISPECIES: hypothetical protein [Methanosarcina]AKB43798.1 hypothetical protein MSVAZ_1529 [Methanosarcina vacuolata Z-761]MCC4766719.1 hypothetical protein [Methanosarcina sp. DH1]
MKKVVILGILQMILLGAFLLSSGCSSSTESTTTSSSTSQSISMITDKTQYVHGEMVKLKVTNNLDDPIWYIGYPQRDLVFWEIEKSQSNGWQSVDFRLPVIEEGKEVCQVILYERPIGDVTELKPHSDLLYEWNQQICSLKTVTEPFEPEIIKRGKYRFVFHYSLFTVKSENVENEPWKRPIDLGETKTIYSNEFVLK